ncbi:DsbA family protein [Demequina sp.]|uniref:DsbA family protein n=1 Tax=Demequina sp. TaxID=2050685 RepID=UPI003A861229
MSKKNGAPKNEKAAAARAQAQKNVKSQERKTMVGIIVGAVAVLAIFGGIVYFIVQSGKIPGLDDPNVVAPAGADATGGIAVGTGGVVGEDVPTDVQRLDVYEDYMCPICGSFEEINAEDINAMREAGTVAVYYHPLAILDYYSMGTQYSTRAANAAATVADAAPEAYLDFSAALYANQPAENTEGLSDAQIEQIAITAGVPEDVAATFEDGKFTKWVIAATDQASQDFAEQEQRTATPTIMLDRTILLQADVPFFEEGVLKAHIESQE